MEKHNKPIYRKPQTQTLGNVLAAEGFCITGGTASKSTCTMGVATFYCSVGGSATDTSRLNICNPGGVAANCFPGSDAGG